MKEEQFYKEYANLPLDKRLVMLNLNEYGLTTMKDLYESIDHLNEHIRTLQIEMDEKLKIAEKYMPLLKVSPQE